jgi:hypothetical protein
LYDLFAYLFIYAFIKKKKKNTTAQIGTNTSIRAREFKAGLLASVVFLGPRANAELVPKFQVELHASHAAIPMVTKNFALH